MRHLSTASSSEAVPLPSTACRHREPSAGSVGFEHSPKTSNPPTSHAGGANSAAPCDKLPRSESRIGQTLATALALIAELPLSRDEKAQAVRRLLAQGDERQ